MTMACAETAFLEGDLFVTVEGNFYFPVMHTAVKIDESNESWVEVCRRSSKIKSSLRKAKYERDGG
jgi:hypothetical protein